jgi:hypothetical protein
VIGREVWQSGQDERFRGRGKAKVFIGGLECFAEDRFEPIWYCSLAVLEIRDVLNESLTTARGEISYLP